MHSTRTSVIRKYYPRLFLEPKNPQKDKLLWNMMDSSIDLYIDSHHSLSLHLSLEVLYDMWIIQINDTKWSLTVLVIIQKQVSQKNGNSSRSLWNIENRITSIDWLNISILWSIKCSLATAEYKKDMGGMLRLFSATSNYSGRIPGYRFLCPSCCLRQSSAPWRSALVLLK